MLKRRASKRFVLAETGEETSWDTTADNDATVAQIPQIDIENVATASPPNEESDPDIALLKFQQQQQQLQASQRLLTVQQLVKPGIK